MTTTDTSNLFDRTLIALESGDDAVLRDLLANQRAADLAEVFEMLDDDGRSRCLYAMPPRTAAEVIVLLHEPYRSDLVDDLDADKVTQIVAELPPDDAADVIAELSDAQTEQLLRDMEGKQSRQIEKLLTYDKDSAGGIMTPEVVAIPADLTVGDAERYVREASPDEDLHEIYIVDDARRLVGVVPLRRLVTNPKTARLIDLCDRTPISVQVDEDQEEVVHIIRKYDLPAVPVVDRNDVLIGRITHDDILDVAEEEAAEDLYRLAGTDAAERESGSTFKVVFVRLRWLLAGITISFATGGVLAVGVVHFTNHEKVYTALLLFVPMIAGLGGNCANQIATVIIRGFADRDLASMKLAIAVARESRIVPMLALLCAGLAFLGILLVLPILIARNPGDYIGVDPSRIALSVGLGMLCALFVSACLGIGMPFTLRRFGADPALASGPLVSALNDVTAITVYLTIAAHVAI